MKNVLYILALLLVGIWAVGFFGYQAQGLIHLLLVIAVIATLLGIISTERVTYDDPDFVKVHIRYTKDDAAPGQVFFADVEIDHDFFYGFYGQAFEPGYELYDAIAREIERKYVNKPTSIKVISHN